MACSWSLRPLLCKRMKCDPLATTRAVRQGVFIVPTTWRYPARYHAAGETAFVMVLK